MGGAFFLGETFESWIAAGLILGASGVMFFDGKGIVDGFTNSTMLL